MKRLSVTMLAALLIACASGGGCSSGGGGTASPLPPSAPQNAIELAEGWAIQSSASIPATGDVVSTPAFSPTGWFAATAPSTVLAALVADDIYPDPFYGMNFHEIPGSRPMGLDVSSSPRPPNSPFTPSWWYRTSFTLPEGFVGERVWLRFDGINFRADIWLNGKLLADRRAVAGALRAYELDATDALRAGRSNVLAVEVVPPDVGDLAYNWVDWGPVPPDRNMGLIGAVTLTSTGPVRLRNPQVISKLDLPSMEEAHLTVTAELVNPSARAVQGTLRATIEDIGLAEEVTLAPGETRLVEFTPDAYPQLNVASPRVWWPARLGPQPLYDCDLSFEVEAQVSDAQSVRFGIREVSSKLTAEGARLFQVNGKDLLIRGGAYSPDILLRPSVERDEVHVRYALDMNLNAIRLEGKPVSERFLALCDELGMLIIAGWCCCDHWENWWSWDEEDPKVAAASLETQVLAMRNHASALAWLNGSDGLPPPQVEKMYDDILARLRWPNAVVSSAKSHVSKLTGPSGVKMTGPYEYVPPEYWLADTTRGGAFGFNTETSPGPAVPPIESLKRILPPEHYWPIDEVWRYHAGRGFYFTLKVFTQGIDERYGPASGIEDYARKAQVIAYDNHRAHFEAYGRNKYHATGVIQWMMNNQWPSMIWHLYDYFLRPGGAYFGAKKGCEPLHVQYSYDDRSIAVVNSYFQGFSNLTAAARVLDFDLAERYANETKLDVAADATVRAFTLPEIPDLSRTYFLKLTLTDAAGKIVSENFYWLSTKPTVFDWDRGDERYTPTTSQADMTLLATLPLVRLEAAESFEPATGEEQTMRVHLRNPSSALAFAVELRLARGPGGPDVTPVFWQDNYFSLLPGEEREVTATFQTASLEGAAPTLEVGGWNAAR